VGDTNGPVMSAPRGYLWRWGREAVAHLTEPTPYMSRTTLCGKLSRGTVFSLTTGGYSARPCPECIEAALAREQGREMPDA